MAKRRGPGKRKRPTPLPRRAPLVGAVGSAALAAGLLGCGPKKMQGQPPQAQDSQDVAPQVAPPPQAEESPPPMVPDDPQPTPPDPVPPMVPERDPPPQPRPPQPRPQVPGEFRADPPPMVEPFDGIAPPRRKR